MDLLVFVVSAALGAACYGAGITYLGTLPIPAPAWSWIRGGLLGLVIVTLLNVLVTIQGGWFFPFSLVLGSGTIFQKIYLVQMLSGCAFGAIGTYWISLLRAGGSLFTPKKRGTYTDREFAQLEKLSEIQQKAQVRWGAALLVLAVLGNADYLLRSLPFSKIDTPFFKAEMASIASVAGRFKEPVHNIHDQQVSMLTTDRSYAPTDIMLFDSTARTETGDEISLIARDWGYLKAIHERVSGNDTLSSRAKEDRRQFDGIFEKLKMQQRFFDRAIVPYFSCVLLDAWLENYSAPQTLSLRVRERLQELTGLLIRLGRNWALPASRAAESGRYENDLALVANMLSYHNDVAARIEEVRTSYDDGALDKLGRKYSDLNRHMRSMEGLRVSCREGLGTQDLTARAVLIRNALSVSRDLPYLTVFLSMMQSLQGESEAAASGLASWLDDNTRARTPQHSMESDPYAAWLRVRARIELKNVIKRIDDESVFSFFTLLNIGDLKVIVQRMFDSVAIDNILNDCRFTKSEARIVFTYLSEINDYIRAHSNWNLSHSSMDVDKFSQSARSAFMKNIEYYGKVGQTLSNMSPECFSRHDSNSVTEWHIAEFQYTYGLFLKWEAHRLADVETPDRSRVLERLRGAQRNFEKAFHFFAHEISQLSLEPDAGVHLAQLTKSREVSRYRDLTVKALHEVEEELKRAAQR